MEDEKKTSRRRRRIVAPDEAAAERPDLARIEPESAPTPSASSIVGADGRTLPEEPWGVSSGVGRMVEENPVLALALSAGIGLIVGMAIGGRVARR